MTSLPEMPNRVPIHITDEILQEIFEIGLRRHPIEACGMLLPVDYKGSQVVELPNRSLEASSSYVIWSDDVEVALGEWAHQVDATTRDAVSVWHTHPSGLVGPSRRDMRSRLPGISYLVVALGERPIPTWF